MYSGKFEVVKSPKNNQYYFHLKAPNGEIIGASEGHTQKHNAKSGVESVRTHSQTDSNFTVWQSTNDSQWYFHLKSPSFNKEIILRSEGYTTKQNAENGIAAVKKYAPDTELIDLTQSKAA